MSIYSFSVTMSRSCSEWVNSVDKFSCQYVLLTACSLVNLSTCIAVPIIVKCEGITACRNISLITSISFCRKRLLSRENGKGLWQGCVWNLKPNWVA